MLREVRLRTLTFATVYTQVVRRSVSVGFSPPKSPILGDFETGISAQSPPLMGDLGGEDLGDDSDQKTRVYTVALRWERDAFGQFWESRTARNVEFK
ncbi:hypothetical protein C7B65_17780 [Phormidesmis priestleyi ULC007]|uniref:Uncharacterized protein n=1 Tax=Phormidesmis priestleyi ULC007 TaxID=1920490 RepID=A0A2T1DB92_9CYAN|nr:hypothetical protein C7B65_17780 [Phormidesmis priestleyi ULC007]PZO48697.1 MAG: hypothetical protein DCF14_16320 [Phormidesmis priestleyi]